jgi:apolipoprotein D and lipocalin family protein
MILLFTLVLSACTSAPQGVQPVSGFDAQRYLGRWYEVARLDHSFERGLSDVTAEYAWREDGGVAVLNRGFHEANGAWDEAQGKAYFIGEPTTGSLKVSFFGPFYGGYHIMALDESAPDYRYALVSGPNLNYLWVLSRTPTLPQATLDELLVLAGEVGFPMDELILVDQSRHTLSSLP